MSLESDFIVADVDKLGPTEDLVKLRQHILDEGLGIGVSGAQQTRGFILSELGVDPADPVTVGRGVEGGNHRDTEAFGRIQNLLELSFGPRIVPRECRVTVALQATLQLKDDSVEACPGNNTHDEATHLVW